jgi:hypothetical protein
LLAFRLSIPHPTGDVKNRQRGNLETNVQLWRRRGSRDYDRLDANMLSNGGLLLVCGVKLNRDNCRKFFAGPGCGNFRPPPETSEK